MELKAPFNAFSTYVHSIDAACDAECKIFLQVSWRKQSAVSPQIAMDCCIGGIWGILCGAGL